MSGHGRPIVGHEQGAAVRIAVVAEHIHRWPWHPSRWATDLADGLAARGHEVAIVCDDIDDPWSAGDRVRLLRRRPGRAARSRQPTRFMRWAARTCAPFDRTISLTHLVAGDLWIACEPRSWHSFVRSVASPSPATVLLEGLSRPWLPLALVGEARAGWGARSRPGVPARIGHARHGETALPLASRLTGEPAPNARRILRSALRIEPEQAFILVSAVDVPARRLRDLLTAVARLRHSARAVLGVLTHEPVRVLRLGHATRVGERLRILGTTTDMASLLSAADLAIVRASGHSGRFLADAIRMGVPALCEEGAAGASVVEPPAIGSGPLGRLVRDRTPAGWANALDLVLEGSTLRQMADAAEAVSAMLAMDHLMDAIERTLEV